MLYQVSRFFVGVVCLVVSAGGWTQAQTQIQYAFWGDTETRDLHVRVAEAFMKAHPDIVVEPVYISDFDAYIQRILTNMAGGTAPDVINFVHNDVRSFAARGVLTDLTEWVERDWEAENFDDVFPHLMEGMQYEGSYYALPRNASGWYLFYNKDLFDAAGVAYPDDSWTWDIMVDAGKQLASSPSEGGQQTWPLAVDASASSNYINFVWQAGGDYFSEDGTDLTLDTPESRQGLEFLHSLIYEHGIAADPGVLATQDARDLFLAGRVAMYMDAGSQIVTFRTIEGFDWGLALLPTGPDGTRWGRQGASGLVIPESSENKEAAWEFIKFVNGPVGQEILISTGFSAPVRSSILNDESRFLPANEFEIDRETALVGIQEHARLLPSHPNWTQIDSITNKWFELYYLNELTLDQTLQSIDREVDPLLQ